MANYLGGGNYDSQNVNSSNSCDYCERGVPSPAWRKTFTVEINGRKVLPVCNECKNADIGLDEDVKEHLEEMGLR